MSTCILIAEDEPHILTSLEFLMQQAGFLIHTTMDGKQVIPLLEQQAIDLLILDVMLPSMDGFDICQQIRANPVHEQLKIVILTARGRDVDREQGIAAGADLYITKPFSTRHLVEQVKQLLA